MIHHVSLECHRDDRDALHAFWAALGFTPVDAPPSLADRADWVQSGATQVHLLWAEDPVVPRKGHVAVQVADHDAAVAALRDGGFAVEAREQHWGAPRSYATCPAGHTVEVFDRAPPGAHSHS
jgi:catechol 2,3-dioxygenase-like lactoylglutathione lyase family enzyme